MLHLLARHGLLLPVAAVGFGAALPGPAALACVALPFAVMALVMVNVLMAEPGKIGRRETLAVGVLIALNLLLVPLALHAAVGLLGLPSLLGWPVLVAAGPVAASTVAAAAALGQPVRPMILANVGSVLLLPFTLPLLALLVIPEAALDGEALLLRAAALVLLPAALAALLRRPLAASGARLRLPLRGLAVLALSGIALAQGGTLPAAIAAIDAATARLLAFGTLAALGVSGLAAAAASRLLGPGRVAGFALGGTCRNVSLVWAALGPWLPPEGLLALMIALLCTFVIPAIAPAGVAFTRWLGAAQAARRAPWSGAALATPEPECEAGR